MDAWWKKVDGRSNMEVPLAIVTRFFMKKGFCHDEMVAEKTIVDILGEEEAEFIGRDEFFKMFYKPIFRISLLDMLNNIAQISKTHQDLPLHLKLAAYKRNLFLCGLDKENNEFKEKGKSILEAMLNYKEEKDPALFKSVSFIEYTKDPYGKNKKIDAQEADRRRCEKFEK